MKFKRSKITLLLLATIVVSCYGYQMAYATESKNGDYDYAHDGSQDADDQIDYEFFEALGLYYTTAVFPESILRIDGTWVIYANGQRRYIHNDNNYTINGWEYIDGHWYFFDLSGYMYTGWLADNGHIYYMSEETLTLGQMTIGWKTLTLPSGGASYWFYFNGSGIMATGWKYIAYNGVSNWYYFNTNGTMHTGWLSNGGYWYYLKTNGVMVTGWYQISNNVGAYWYFFDSNGRMVTGWNTISGNVYYFNSNGMMQTGWNTIEGNTYYFDANGIMQTGWNTIAGNTYYFDANGIMQIGWLSYGGYWYYLNDNGVMITGWKTIAGNRYYFGLNGVMYIGWNTINGNTYYFASDGVMVVGWREIAGDLYYFGLNGVMRKGYHRISGIDYYFGNDGKLSYDASGVAVIYTKDYGFPDITTLIDGSIASDFLDDYYTIEMHNNFVKSDFTGSETNVPIAKLNKGIFYYSGHGLPNGGGMALGSNETITPSELRDLGMNNTKLALFFCCYGGKINPTSSLSLVTAAIAGGATASFGYKVESSPFADSLVSTSILQSMCAGATLANAVNTARSVFDTYEPLMTGNYALGGDTSVQIVDGNSLRGNEHPLIVPDDFEQIDSIEGISVFKKYYDVGVKSI